MEDRLDDHCALLPMAPDHLAAGRISQHNGEDRPKLSHAGELIWRCFRSLTLALPRLRIHHLVTVQVTHRHSRPAHHVQWLVLRRGDTQRPRRLSYLLLRG